MSGHSALKRALKNEFLLLASHPAAPTPHPRLHAVPRLIFPLNLCFLNMNGFSVLDQGEREDQAGCLRLHSAGPRSGNHGKYQF